MLLGLLVLAVMLAVPLADSDDSDAAPAEGKFYIGADETVPYDTYAEAVGATGASDNIITIKSGAVPVVITGADLDAAKAGFAGGYDIILAVDGSLTVEGFNASVHTPVLKTVRMQTAGGALSVSGTSDASNPFNIETVPRTTATIGIASLLTMTASGSLDIHAVTGTEPSLDLRIASGGNIVFHDTVVLVNVLCQSAATLNGAAPGTAVKLGGDLTLGNAAFDFSTDLLYISDEADPHSISAIHVPALNVRGSFTELSFEGDCTVTAEQQFSSDRFTVGYN